MPTSTLDWRVIIKAPLQWFVWWLLLVLLVTWRGYPGVICATPMTWLLALPVGLGVAWGSASPQPAQRRREAALAGALLGLLQAVLFGVLVLVQFEILPGERWGAAVMIAAVVGVGLPVSTGLAWLMAAQAERQRRSDSGGAGD